MSNKLALEAANLEIYLVSQINVTRCSNLQNTMIMGKYLLPRFLYKKSAFDGTRVV